MTDPEPMCDEAAFADTERYSEPQLRGYKMLINKL